ncbi:Peroxisomal membrane protein PAS20 [Entophlyctis luteolus]|nr:Peroxisomal membrane protein PAS20 [Entophlyctis luteolus]
MGSPPKPWETSAPAASAASGPMSTAPDQLLQSVPPVPARPAAFTTSDMSPNNPDSIAAGLNRPYGAGAYGGNSMPYNTAYNAGYSTGYGGAYGSSLYDQGSYGGYGSGYGYNRMSTYNRFGSGYGMGGYGGYGGYNGYGPGMMRPGFNPNNPNEIPLTAQIEQSTQYAFQSIDQVVQAFTGFSQMLESTFFATHSSFMAMVGVAEQLGNLRNYLGGILSAIAITDSLKRWIYHVTGRRMPVDANAITAEGFEKYANGSTGSSAAAAKNRKPVLLFLLFMFGFPWLMSKIIQRLQKKQLEDAAAAASDPTRALIGGPIIGPDGNPLQLNQIKDLEFCRALFDFTGSSPAELTFKQGDFIAILTKVDPVTKQPMQWWRGRLRTGEIGHFPANYVEIVEKKLAASSTSASASPAIPSSAATAVADESLSPMPGVFPKSQMHK